MNLLLEQREALQKQVGELTSQLAASRESQEGTVQRAQQEVNEAQEESRQKLLEVEHVQKMLEEAEHQNKELLILSMEEKDLHLRTLEEENLALNSQMSQLRSTLQQAQKLCSKYRRELQELNTQIWAQLDAVRQKAAREAAEEKQVLETEVSELRVRLQSSEERAEAVAIQRKAAELELKKTKAQRDRLKAENKELLKQLEEMEQGLQRAEKKHTSRETAMEKEASERQEEAVTLCQKVPSLKRKLESLEKERKDVQQAVGAEGKQVSEHSREGVECVQDLVATSAEVKTEKRESTTEPRRTGELVKPEGRRIRSFKRVFLPDYIKLRVSDSDQQTTLTSQEQESSSSLGEQ
ncbi:calponin homology domain-containing protein DDB_G0272472-like [Hirundo rustica]|uniref:calponin homology domain-containing protein DDB_G0272472-like n=1 Tax=Hirundo rustica TaxID=43150 RepID=UPI002671B5E5|nr:calponin homology domain-containing protein DDB_G0272472-like [Hirundo rustica]